MIEHLIFMLCIAGAVLPPFHNFDYKWAWGCYTIPIGYTMANIIIGWMA